MEFEYKKLKGKIVERFGDVKRFAFEMGMSNVTLCLRLGNKSPFKVTEVLKASKLLKIKQKDIPLYFFTLKVMKS